MAKIDVKNHDDVYLLEEYTVMSQGGCCVIGKIEYDWQDYEWIFTPEESERDKRLYQGELEQILYVVDKLNRRDKAGKYKKPTVVEIVHKQANEAIDSPF